MSESIGVVIVDDHAMVRMGLRTMLTQEPDIAVLGEAGTVADALDVIQAHEPDVVLLDLRLGEEEGVDVARGLRAQGSEVTILMLSIHDSSRHLRDALASGADGYLLKSVAADDLINGIRSCHAGETVIGQEFVPKLLADAQRGVPMGQPGVTKREQEVLELVAKGKANREIAEDLGISARTAQKHMENLFKKFDVHDRTELVAHAFRRGLLG